jgi:hypothetical protein
MLNVQTIRKLAQLLFWPAVAITIIGAVIPPFRIGDFLPWDKAAHFLAFYVLTLLAVAAFPRRSILVIGVALSTFGALIEVVQATPLVHRDADWHDWLTDTIAIVAVMLPMLAARWRSG